jgi:hypothetical protein
MKRTIYGTLAALVETSESLSDAARQYQAALDNGSPVREAELRRRIIYAINVLAAELAELESGYKE